MTVRGYVRNGVVVLYDQLLPEGTEVICTVVVQTDVQAVEAEPHPFAEMMKFAGMFEGEPADGSEKHDKYIYGHTD